MATPLRRPFSARRGRAAAGDAWAGDARPESARARAFASYFDRLSAQQEEQEHEEGALARLPRVHGDGPDAARPASAVGAARPQSARPRSAARARPASAHPRARQPAAPQARRRSPYEAPASSPAYAYAARPGSAHPGSARHRKLARGASPGTTRVVATPPPPTPRTPVAQVQASPALGCGESASAADASALRFLFSERQLAAARRLAQWHTRDLALMQRPLADAAPASDAVGSDAPEPQLRHLDVFAEPAPDDDEGLSRWDAAVQALLRGENGWPEGLIPPYEAIAKEAGAADRVAYLPGDGGAGDSGARDTTTRWGKPSSCANWRRYASRPLDSPVDVEALAAWASQARLSAGSTAGAEEVAALLRLNQALLADLLARRAEVFSTEAEYWERRANNLEALLRSRNLPVPAAPPMPDKVAAEVKHRRPRPAAAPPIEETAVPKPAEVTTATAVAVSPSVRGTSDALESASSAAVAAATAAPPRPLSRLGRENAERPPHEDYFTIEEEDENEPDEVVYAGEDLSAAFDTVSELEEDSLSLGGSDDAHEHESDSDAAAAVESVLDSFALEDDSNSLGGSDDEDEHESDSDAAAAVENLLESLADNLVAVDQSDAVGDEADSSEGESETIRRLPRMPGR